MKQINVAVVGATGLVGKTMLQVLAEKNIKIKQLYCYASAGSAGKQIEFKGKKLKVIELNEQNIKNKKIDYVLFSAGSEVSRRYAKVFTQQGAIVIDNSSAWRMEENVPLVVPEVNPEEAHKHKGIISNPNCSTIQCVLPLKVVQDMYGIEQVVFTTFQAVSGSGIKGIRDLESTKIGQPPAFYPHPIYNNCLPHIDQFLDSGYTKEEIKMQNETRKILGIPDLAVSATCVRVPVLNGHSVDIMIKTKKEPCIKQIRDKMREFGGIVVVDNPESSQYPLATMATGKDEVFVGRLRRDLSCKEGIRMFCTSDNVRKGAATNAVQILCLLIEKNQNTDA